jgi:hypothetical protein
MWLNKHDLDVTCIRLKPYKVGDRVVLDVTQLIPLPEAADYEVKVRAQAQETKKVRTARQELFRRFWSQLIDRSRSQTQMFAHRSTTTDHWLSAGKDFEGGWRTPEGEWPALQDRVVETAVRLEKALKNPIQNLKIAETVGV